MEDDDALGSVAELERLFQNTRRQSITRKVSRAAPRWFRPALPSRHMRQVVLFHCGLQVSQLRETISRNPTVSSQCGAVIG
ncbi:hypothetical protein EYF80_062510 [Liparis tanakae]|uniref:Uncharacterized protein n=1 Tax=Liparis tanakae TaxID=230148 RepID=A0A4Z2EF68_9TELE|nr:hypothetical protein EYF80_062510 [Liparis tanakae]